MLCKALKFFACVLLFMAVASVLLVACERPGEGGNVAPSANGSGTPTVHMGDIAFVQSTVTVKKGESITLIDDSATPHIIENGTWKDGTARPNKEKGAPTVEEQFQGNDSHKVGPFNVAGIFQLYCTIHPNMNLTVTVQ